MASLYPAHKFLSCLWSPGALTTLDCEKLSRRPLVIDGYQSRAGKREKQKTSVPSFMGRLPKKMNRYEDLYEVPLEPL